ncbi:MAG: D-alanine--D-alanine ligase [Deltaproteobacteria bacterium]|nr:D-alanine--D-alanine ligase [Deltaproteobacteria bacterium]
MSMRVGVIMGGWSSEHDVSLRTGDAVAEALGARGHEVVRLVIPQSMRNDSMRGNDLMQALVRAQIDVAFLALHGRMGEDGCVQGMLEVARIPYTGSGVLASALAMDKKKSKELFLLHNVPTPPYYTVSVDDDLADIETVHRHFGFPVVVKPRGEGSSVGLSKVRSLPELARALEKVFDVDDHALVERFIEGAEVNVAVLDGKPLGAIEICPKSGGMYDYQAKYMPGATEYHMPARLTPARYQNVLNLAVRACEALDVTGAARVDLLVTPGENEYVLEVNTLPGMTATSLLPKIARHAGWEFGELCERILEGARLHTPDRLGEDAPRRSGVVRRRDSLALATSAADVPRRSSVG